MKPRLPSCDLFFSVDEGGLAEAQGLNRGDMLVSINGIDVTDATQAQCVQAIRTNSNLVLSIQVHIFPRTTCFI